MERKVYQMLATAFDAMKRCEETGNESWVSVWESRIEWLTKNNLPKGSGFDCGTEFDVDASKRNRLVFNTEFHHMNEAGFYDGWSKHSVSIVPDFVLEYDMKVSGRDRNGIKEYIAQTFGHYLDYVLTESELAEYNAIRPEF